MILEGEIESKAMDARTFAFVMLAMFGKAGATYRFTSERTSDIISFRKWEFGMRTKLIAMLAAGGIALFSTSPTLGAPANGAVIASAADAISTVLEARIWCTNSRGKFLYWGHCKRTPTGCYNRRGRRVHAGHCRGNE